MRIERCVENLEQAILVEHEDADRLELCSRLDLDGLTPGQKTFLSIREKVPLPIRAMIRIHPGPFVANSQTLEEMIQQISWFKENKVDGFVLGLLKDGNIDVEGCQSLLEECHPLPVTFHKAFDACENLEENLSTLIKMGFESVLTSGGCPTAKEGAPMLQKLVSLAGNHIHVIVAGKVRPYNLSEIERETKASYFHYRVDEKTIPKQRNRT